MAVVGSVVAGVRLTALVGRGATGTVWAGREVLGGGRVAVKLLDDPVDAATEARLLGGVRHPHVVRLRRVSTAPPALVLDLAEGGSVASLVVARGPLDPGEVVTVLAPLADALAEVHASGAVHGDVTAANVLLGSDGRPLLADLGSGRLLGSGEVVATEGYAAPEVLAGGAPGSAADVHGLGAVGWFALTGAPPAAVADRLPLVLLAPDCPEEMVRVVVRAVDPDPAQRPTLAELAELLHAAVPARPVRLVAAAMPALPPDEAVTHRIRSSALADRETDAGAGSRHGARRRTSPRLPRAAVLAVVTVAALALVGLAAVVGPDPTWSVWGPRPLAAAPAERSPGPESEQPLPTWTPPPPTVPEVDLATIATELVAARGDVLRAGDVVGLADVHVDGSHAHRVDELALADGALDVSYSVLSASPDPAQEAVVRLDVLTSTGAAASVREQVRVTLRQVDGQWRVATVEEAG